jgi:hypothetical protein
MSDTRTGKGKERKTAASAAEGARRKGRPGRPGCQPARGLAVPAGLP